MVEMGLKHTSNDKAQALYLYPMLSPSVINNAFSSVLILIGKKEGKRKTEGQGGREREREKEISYIHAYMWNLEKWYR